MNEETKIHWVKILTIAIASFLASFLAFYIIMQIMVNRIEDSNDISKIIKQEERIFQKYRNENLDNPFIPRMRPMIVNLVKENNEYKVIVDLTQLDDNEKSIKIDVENKILTVSGELDKKSFGNEKIINFTQAYYLDEDLNLEKMIKEKRGHKYIITIPFED